MKKVTFTDRVNSVPQYADFVPSVSYLLSDYDAEGIREFERIAGSLCMIEDISREQWKEQGQGTLLIYNTGAIGDQLMTTFAVRKIKERYPDLDIDVACHRHMANVWAGNDDIRSVKFIPIINSFAETYGHVLYWDWILRDEKEKNCYEVICELIGEEFRPEDNPRPFLEVSKYDESLAFSSCGVKDSETGKLEATRGHIVLGLHSRSKARNLHTMQMVQLVKNLSVWARGAIIYGVSDSDFGAEVQTAIMKLDLPNYIPCHNILNIRQIAVLCYYAGVVIAPDSMLVHLAASQNAPCVALMSTIEPKLRTSTYPLCVPVYKPECCPFSSCNWKETEFLFQIGETMKIAPCYSPSRTMCNNMAGIETKDIIEAAEKAAELKMKFDGYKYPFLT